jgi:hypothetical protein
MLKLKLAALRQLKTQGLPDSEIAGLLGCHRNTVWRMRKVLGIRPVKWDRGARLRRRLERAELDRLWARLSNEEAADLLSGAAIVEACFGPGDRTDGSQNVAMRH